jgi:Fur family peroxide stress response transcriptional regulator
VLILFMKRSDAYESTQQMLAQVREAGLKLTPQRMAIVRELAGDPTHPTAQELFHRLRQELPTMSFATVYNTLSALASAGLCASRSLTRGPARFDPNTEPHDHAVCDGCGKVLDVPRGAGRATPRLDGFEVHAVERIFHGYCSACSPDG